MDLNGDGFVDILSGSYSRPGPDMAGLFQVLWGTKGSAFKKAEPLTGADGKHLVIPAKQVTDAICTRPTAVDLNGDGFLDIVSGNFSGTFVVFWGEAGGKFASESQVLTGRDESPLKVQMHSDPFFVDWDGDGDLDLVSGSAQGGASLFTNEGSSKKARFSEPKTLVQGQGGHEPDLRLGNAHIKGPQSSTRVFVADVNEDGKLDLLLGDAVRLNWPAEGVTEADVKGRHKAWQEKLDKLMKVADDAQGDNGDAVQKLFESRKEFLREEATGFVWVYYQK